MSRRRAWHRRGHRCPTSGCPSPADRDRSSLNAAQRRGRLQAMIPDEAQPTWSEARRWSPPSAMKRATSAWVTGRRSTGVGLSGVQRSSACCAHGNRADPRARPPRACRARTHVVRHRVCRVLGHDLPARQVVGELVPSVLVHGLLGPADRGPGLRPDADGTRAHLVKRTALAEGIRRNKPVLHGDNGVPEGHQQMRDRPPSGKCLAAPIVRAQDRYGTTSS